MQINIPDPIFQTQIFTVILLLAIFLSIKKDPVPHSLSISHTNELKGLAILMVIFVHIGYFLDSSDKFLYPLSVAGGVGVNIFLLLSGFGLTFSALKSNHSISFHGLHTKFIRVRGFLSLKLSSASPLSYREILKPNFAFIPELKVRGFGEAVIVSFYLKRLKKIFIPMWVILIIFLILDFFILHQTYSNDFLISSFLGFFPSADIYLTFNSPLWYFSLILFYYLIFPLLYIKKQPIISVILVFLVSYLILHFNLVENFVDKDVLKLYKLHYFAFPLGMGLAILQNSRFSLTKSIQGVSPILKYLLVSVLLVSVGYTAIHSGVGEEVKVEQFISLITMISFLFIIILKNFQSRFLILLGVYSYEIYLIQWPILYRYDFLYKFLPASLATALYLVVFIAFGYCLNKLIKFTLKS